MSTKQLYYRKEIFTKEMYFLVPFYIFTHESQFKEYNTDSTKLNSLKAEYQDIINRLEAVLSAGKISEYTKCTIVDMAGKVLEHIAQKYNNVREGVKSVMGGKVLEYEAKTIRLEGEREGRLKGEREGRLKGEREGRLKGEREGRLKGEREGRLKGKSEGRLELLADLVKEGILSISDAAAKVMLSEEEFVEKMQKYTEN